MLKFSLIWKFNFWTFVIENLNYVILFIEMDLKNAAFLDQDDCSQIKVGKCLKLTYPGVAAL